MIEPSKQDTRVVAAMRLSGRRFDPVGMPADALVEVAAFEDLLRSLMRLYWFDRNPNRTRLPKGYDHTITLRLTAIAEGSAVPVLEYDGALIPDDIFGPHELTRDFARAIQTLGDFITYSFSDISRIPRDIRRLPSSKVKRFGQTMQEGEAIQISSTVPTDATEWEAIPRYTREVRTNALVGLIGSFTQPVTVEGQVIDFKVGSGQLVIRSRDHGGDISIPYQESDVKVSIVGSPESQLFSGQAEGIGEFNADGRLTKLVSVSSLAVVDVTQDARIARTSLETLAELATGWVDGESGEPTTPTALARGRAVIEAMIALNNITRTVAPTEEGGVTFFWPEAENQLSIEVEPTGALYIHTTDLAAGTFSDGLVPAGDDNLIDALDSWLSEAAGND